MIYINSAVDVHVRLDAHHVADTHHLTNTLMRVVVLVVVVVVMVVVVVSRLGWSRNSFLFIGQGYALKLALRPPSHDMTRFTVCVCVCVCVCVAAAVMYVDSGNVMLTNNTADQTVLRREGRLKEYDSR